LLPITLSLFKDKQANCPMSCLSQRMFKAEYHVHATVNRFLYE